MTKHIDQSVLISTITNVFYMLAGYYMITIGVIAPGVASILLGFGSGIHHYYLQSWSRPLDYLGMYWVIISMMLFGLGAPTLANSLVTLAAGLILLALFKSSRVVVGTLIGALFILTGILAGIYPLIYISSIFAIAYMFNYIGDNVHKAHHDIIHSGWHILTSFGLIEVAEFFM